MRRSKQGVARSALKFGFGLGMAITLFSLSGLLISPEIGHVRLMLSLFFLVTASIPPFLAYTAVLMTVAGIRERQFELLYVTTISDARLLEGHILSALYRNRRLLLMVIGFAPIAIVWMLYVSTAENYVRCLHNVNPSRVCQPSSLISVLSALLAFIAISISVGGTCFLSTILGVWFAVWWRNRFFSSIVAVMLALTMVMILVIASITLSIPDLLQRHLLYPPILYLFCGFTILVARSLARRSV